MIYGYTTQLEGMQLDEYETAFRQHGCCEVIVEPISSLTRPRERWLELVASSKTGDTIIIRQTTDIALRIQDLLQTFSSLIEKGIQLIDLNSSLHLKDASPREFCDALTAHEQLARALRYVYAHLPTAKKIGRPTPVSDEMWRQMKKELDAGLSVKEVARAWKVPVNAIYYRKAKTSNTQTASDVHQIDIEQYLKNEHVS